MLFMVHEGNSINLLAQKKEKILAYYIYMSFLYYNYILLRIGLKVLANYEPIFRFPKNREIISPALQFSNIRKKCSLYLLSNASCVVLHYMFQEKD